MSSNYRKHASLNAESNKRRVCGMDIHRGMDYTYYHSDSIICES